MKLVALGLVGVGVLAAAVWGGLSALDKPIAFAPSASLTQPPSPVSTPQITSPTFAETAKDSCGDPPSPGTTWYGVFIDSGNLNEIRAKYCRDAIDVIRQDTGASSIQVASFTDLSRAEAFAKSVNGTVSQYDPNTMKAEAGSKVETLGESTSTRDPLLRQAANQYAAGNYEESLKLFQKIVDQDTTNPRAWRNVGEAYHATGDDYNAKLAMDKSRELYLQNGDQNGAAQVSFQLEGWMNQTNSRQSINADIIPTETHSSGSGRCNSPNDLDVRGHRCGGRAKGMRHR